MRKFYKILSVVLIACIAVPLCACGVSERAKTEGSGVIDVFPGIIPGKISGDVAGGITDGGYIKDGYYLDDREVYGGEDSDIPQEYDRYGLMTASAWNDNENYDYYKSLFFKGQEESDNGKFQKYTDPEYSWGFNSLNRIKVTVNGENGIISGAEVICVVNNEIKFTAKTDNAGVAYLFTDSESGVIRVLGTETPFDKDNRDLVIKTENSAEKLTEINLMLVIDVTGSMGDELEYLKSELKNVINRVSTATDGAKTNLSVLFYRDDEDQEKFSAFDFTDVTKEENLTGALKFMGKQKASGGGDYPEAVDEALELAMQKKWTDGVNIIFHVLDAPPHDEKIYQERYNKAVMSAAKQGVRICPLICSGADELCEYLVRQAAIMTGGTFCYVTDHSGIGNSHLDPDIPNAVVEKLNDLMVRLITGYYNGTFESPVDYRTESEK